ncbi:MAG: aminotransferase class I/II-fold pyridoxal phosphate-dependent enzyme [Thermoplasmata archaeon]|nr:aminotransferase class I/II-fold pyridoxal phosphate-dependent enzyme [Thermoplasmata archaeon]
MSAQRPAELPRFPLAQWIYEHRHLPHDLGQSGMHGELRSLAGLLRDAPPATPEELRALFARQQRVPVERMFLTHGATEANTLVLLHLARTGRPRGPRRARFEWPEYPPLRDAAKLVGLRPVSAGTPAEIAILSNPSNPEGRLRSAEEVRRFAAGAEHLLVDETFREFTDAAPLRERPGPRLWRTGSLTKAYGADELRVGFVVAPTGEEERFQSTHWLIDGVPAASASAAVALLSHQSTVLAETRRLFQRNLAALRDAEPDAPQLAAPLWFDRVGGPQGGDRLAHRAARHGVLVCPGSFFGDPSGVRVSLTRSDFPESLAAYLGVRQGSPSPMRPGAARRRRTG